MQKFKQVISAGVISVSLFGTAFADKVIGILVPISLPAMDQIVSGYESQLQKSYSGKVRFLVKNAEGSALIQQSILQEFLDQNVDVIAPIGTDATEMAAHLDKKNIPIVAIAADRPAGLTKDANLTNVLDEISVEKQIHFIHQVLPSLKKMTLVYSADDRIFVDVKAAQKAAQQEGIALQTLMVQQLSDIYSVKSHIDADSQALFILKDELVVSGVGTLAEVARQRHIPVIASDDGSVQNGAAFALGVRESDIGKDSALATAKVLNGEHASQIPSFVMTDYTVFVNEKSAKAQGLDPTFIRKVTQQKGLAYDAITA